MGWTRKHHRHNGHKRKEAFTAVSYDQQGNTKRETWPTTWTTGSTRWAKRLTNRQYRCAHKLQIQHELYQDAEWQDELWGQESGWEVDDWYYDDLPDWWYGMDEPEEDPYEPDYDPYYYDQYYAY